MSTVFAGTVDQRTLPAGHVATITPGIGGTVIVQRLRSGAVLAQDLIAEATNYGPYTLDMALRLSALSVDALYTEAEATISTANTVSVNSPFSASVEDSPGSTVNDYSPAGWDASTTRRLLITAASGGTTITGFDATGAQDGDAAKYVRNQSTTDSLKIEHMSVGSATGNLVSCPGGDEYVVPKLSGFFLIRVGSVWTIR